MRQLPKHVAMLRVFMTRSDIAQHDPKHTQCLESNVVAVGMAGRSIPSGGL